MIEREIAADDGKGFRVLAEAFGFEPFPREPPARQIAIARVDLAKPAFILPGTAADENVLRRQRLQTRGKPSPVEAARLVEERTYHAWQARK